jgi:methionyl-tRNA synthetase
MMIQSIRKHSADTATYIEQFRLQMAMGIVIELTRLGNKYINDREPWRNIEAAQEKAATTLYTAAQIVKALAILIAPFLPFTAEEVWRLLNLPYSVHAQRWESAVEELPPNHKIKKPQPIFYKIELSEVKRKMTMNTGSEGEGKVTMEDLARMDLRVGEIVHVEPVPGSTKLYKLKIDVGGAELKTAVAGLKGSYSVEELKNKLVAVVVNMKPQKIFGVESEVMILAGVDSGTIAILQPERRVKTGSKIG